MVLFNSPLPYLKDRMADIVGTRPAREASDYFLRQGLDPDGLAAELATPEQRRRYIALQGYLNRYVRERIEVDADARGPVAGLGVAMPQGVGIGSESGGVWHARIVAGGGCDPRRDRVPSRPVPAALQPRGNCLAISVW